MKEIWKDVPGFEGHYQASNKSRIRNSKTGRILKPHLHHSNYYTICFKIKGRPKYLSWARVIALTWIPNPENKKEVNHVNGVKLDNSIVNLEWVHPSENINHYYYKLDKGSKRAVIQKDMSGNKIKEWPSISMAARSIGKNCGNIVTVCQGKNHYAYGFKWSYAD